MSLGRNFTEALQKAMRSLDTKGSVFHWEGEPDVTALLEAVKRPTQDRIIQISRRCAGERTWRRSMRPPTSTRSSWTGSP